MSYEHSFVHQVNDFLEGPDTGNLAMPTFRDSLRTQCVLSDYKYDFGKVLELVAELGGRIHYQHLHD